MNSTSKPTYLAAQAVAETLEKHFATLLAQARQADEKDLAAPPDQQVIQTIVDTTFWASLRREEGHFPKISLAYLHPTQTTQPMLFARRYALTPEVLTKLAPAVERPGIHLGVWTDQEGLYLWGTARTIPHLCFVLEDIEPGLLVVKYRSVRGLGKFVNVAVMQGGQVKVLDEGSTRLPDCPSLLTSLLGLHTSQDHTVNVLIQLATSMRAHHRGGTLLVVPADTHTWRASIIHPIKYAVEPAFTGLAEIVVQDHQDAPPHPWRNALDREVESLAGLTAVDGATLISDRYELMAFGAKIGRASSSQPVEQLLMTEPILGSEPMVMHPSQSGGTRHLSAAQFVYDQPDALALVASQDGRFTVFSWSPCAQMVQAHRIEALLL